MYQPASLPPGAVGGEWGGVQCGLLLEVLLSLAQSSASLLRWLKPEHHWLSNVPCDLPHVSHHLMQQLKVGRSWSAVVQLPVDVIEVVPIPHLLFVEPPVLPKWGPGTIPGMAPSAALLMAAVRSFPTGPAPVASP